MTPSWIVLVPPLLVISCVLITRRMILSFLIGILASALIVKSGNVMQALTLSAQRLWASTGLGSLTSIERFLSSWNLLIFIFLICLGIIIVLLSQSGAARAYVHLVRKRVSSKKGAESATLILSLFFFIDDYFSALTVGSVMRPLALLYNVHPVKLAFLTTAMATPLTLLSPVSSWVGEIVLQLKQVGIGPEGPKTVIMTDPYLLFTWSIPFLLYPLLLVFGTWYIVLRGISYGPMSRYDREKAPTNNNFHEERPASLVDFLVPIIVLVGTVFGMMLFTGNYSLFGGTETLVGALKNAAVPRSLFTGGCVCLLVSTLIPLIRGTIPVQKIGTCFVNGFNLMFPSLVMLVCAWSLGAILKNDLKTGTYIAQQVSAIINVELFPVLIFLCTALIAWLIGSAWATIGLMFPIVIDMLQKLMQLAPNTPLNNIELIIPLVGATLSGAIMGVHLSVLSDNPIMSAASTGADHLEHVKSMAWYVVPIGISAAVGFTLIGLMIDNIGLYRALALGISVSILLAVLLLESGNYLLGRTD